MTTFSLKLEGAKELEKKLRGLETKVARKIARKAVRAGAKVIQTAVKANALNMVGGQMGELLGKNIVVRAFEKQRRGSYGVSVKINPKEQKFVHVAADGTRYYIPNAIEYGHAKPGRGGGETKDIPAIPFQRSAEDANKEKALAAVNAEAERGIKAVWESK